MRAHVRVCARMRWTSRVRLQRGHSGAVPTTTAATARTRVQPPGASPLPVTAMARVAHYHTANNGDGDVDEAPGYGGLSPTSVMYHDVHTPRTQSAANARARSLYIIEQATEEDIPSTVLSAWNNIRAMYQDWNTSDEEAERGWHHLLTACYDRARKGNPIPLEALTQFALQYIEGTHMTHENMYVLIRTIVLYVGRETDEQDNMFDFAITCLDKGQHRNIFVNTLPHEVVMTIMERELLYDDILRIGNDVLHDTVIQLTPDFVSIMLHAQVNAKRLPDARHLLIRAVRSGVANAKSYEAVITRLCDEDFTSEAFKLYSDVLMNGAFMPTPNTVFAVVYQLILGGAWDEVDKMARLAKRMGDEQEQAVWVALIEAGRKHKRLDTVLHAVKMVSSFETYSPLAIEALSSYAAAFGDNVMATSVLQQVRDADEDEPPYDRECFMNLMMAFRRAGDVHEARRVMAYMEYHEYAVMPDMFECLASMYAPPPNCLMIPLEEWVDGRPPHLPPTGPVMAQVAVWPYEARSEMVTRLMREMQDHHQLTPSPIMWRHLLLSVMAESGDRELATKYVHEMVQQYRKQRGEQLARRVVDTTIVPDVDAEDTADHLKPKGITVDGIPFAVLFALAARDGDGFTCVSTYERMLTHITHYSSSMPFECMMQCVSYAAADDGTFMGRSFFEWAHRVFTDMRKLDLLPMQTFFVRMISSARSVEELQAWESLAEQESAQGLRADNVGVPNPMATAIIQGYDRLGASELRLNAKRKAFDDSIRAMNAERRIMSGGPF